MEQNWNSRYFKDIAQELKPHPKFEGMRWAVFAGEKMTAVVMEIEPGVTRERENPPPNPFTGGHSHFHSNFEQVAFFLGCTSDSPDEAKTRPVYTLSNHSNERGLTGSGAVVWLPRYTVHDIPVPPEEERKFLDEYYPDGYPRGLKYFIMDIFSPARPEYVEYFQNQPAHF